MTATNMCYNFVGFGCSPSHLKAHTIRNKLIAKVSARKKGGKVMTATNMCSNFVISGVVPSLCIYVVSWYWNEKNVHFFFKCMRPLKIRSIFGGNISCQSD